MTIDVEVLGEAYNVLKQYIPEKDRQEAADNLMSIMVDLLTDHDLKDFATNDTALRRAFKEYASQFEEDEDYDDYQD